MRLKLAIVGSRTFNDYVLVRETLKDFEIEEIVSGGAKGADRLAERYARDFGFPTKIFLPDWEGQGKAAGFIRNKEIVDYSDGVIAFWDKKSKGTKNSIDLATQQNKLLKVIHF